MNQEKLETRIDPLLKDEINKEGWGGEDGNAAVFVGSEKEVKQAEQRLESEGVCADAASYIRLNKKIVVPAEKISDEIKQDKGKGWIGNTAFEFIDSEGNVCSVDINYGQIASIGNGHWEDNVKQFVGELRKCGFNIILNGFQDPSYREIQPLKNDHKADLEKQSKEAKKDAFDF